jgi:hypothetical protein
MNRLVRRVTLTMIGLLAVGLPAVVAGALPAQAAPPVPCTGNLQVTNTDTHTVIGFVSKTWNSFGEFVVTTTPSDYLSVSLAPGAQQNITAVNGQDPSFPLVGAIVGFSSTSDNLASGSPNYAYLGGTTATPPGSPPAAGANAFTHATGIGEHIESAIWTINDANMLSPQWINTDSSQPATHLVDITNILVVTGDVTAFTNTFGPNSNVALTFVPTAACTDNDLALTAVPSNITVPATGPSGAIVTYTPPTAGDEGGNDPAATVACSPASGSLFPIGTTTVTCTATDADDSNSPVTASFTVTVVGDTDLALTNGPANITTNATQLGGATVTSTAPTVVDEDNPRPTVACSPASGSVFPIGTTTVTCTATDADDTNSPVTATFTVTVVPGPLNHLVLAPASSTIAAGHSQTYTARGADQFGNDLGDKTAATTFTISNGGTCAANKCTGPVGTHTVTGTTGSPAVTGTATLVVTKAPTKTTVTASPSTPALGSPVTFTATVVPSPADPLTPTGTVSFFLDGSATAFATVPLSGSTASVTLTGLGAGNHTVKATYNGDANFASSSSTTRATVTVMCTTTVTGNHAGLVLGPGTTCLLNANISGSVVVPKGSSLDVEGSTISGSITSTGGAAFIRVCGSSAGSVTVDNSTGPVVIGDVVDGCATNTFSGSLTVINNTGGVQVIGNHVGGAVTASGNSGAGPFPDDTAPNISGNGH